LDAPVRRLPGNVALLSGYWRMTGAALIFPREGAAASITPLCIEAESPESPWEASLAFYPYARLAASGFVETSRARKEL